MRRALVCGAGGFIGSHMVTRLKAEGYYVVGVDLKLPEFHESDADLFLKLDLRKRSTWETLISLGAGFHETYQFAADMGGAGYIFTGDNDAAVMHNSALINLLCCEHSKYLGVIFYSSSACIYPARNQQDPDNPMCSEDSAYPADPDSEYGWEKLFSERLYKAFERNQGLEVRIARFHNIFGPNGTFQGGREKAPAAMARKALELRGRDDPMEVWGSGVQTRSFLYIDDCINAVRLLMKSDYSEPVNIGSEEMISINGLAQMALDLVGLPNKIKNVPGPEGVKGRNSDNKIIESVLNWKPRWSLKDGMREVIKFIKDEEGLSW